MALASLILRFPNTTFIGTHVSYYDKNLENMGALLDCCPNFYLDISVRIGEEGR